MLITWSPTDERFEVMKKCFDSVVRHTQCPHKLIVVDNGPERQSEWLKQQKRIDVLIKPDVNLGVGESRNLGASKAVGARCIAFIDNDMIFFPKWLKAAVGVLRQYRAWPLIIVPNQSSPMRKRKHEIGRISHYRLFNRASGQAVIMRMADYRRIGPWALHSKPGGDYCDRARRLGYVYAWYEGWKAQHLCKKASYNHRDRLVNGVWVSPQEARRRLSEGQTAPKESYGSSGGVKSIVEPAMGLKTNIDVFGPNIAGEWQGEHYEMESNLWT